jgi:hypothetical protein
LDGRRKEKQFEQRNYVLGGLPWKSVPSSVITMAGDANMVNQTSDQFVGLLHVETHWPP